MSTIFVILLCMGKMTETGAGREALADKVIEGFSTAFTKLAEYREEIEQLWREFEELKPGELIKGCATKREFAKRHLKRTMRAVQLMLKSGEAKRSENVSLDMRNPEALTPNGHFRADVTSWLQKSIRRGNEDDALYAAAELDLYGAPEHVWHRLFVICSEDIGLAESGLLTDIEVLHRKWQQFRGNPEARLFMIHAVMLLCRGRKSRLVLHGTNWAYLDRTRREIPDYAFDMHSATGKKLGRGIDHFLEEGAHLENKADIPDRFEEPAVELLLQQEAQQ